MARRSRRKSRQLNRSDTARQLRRARKPRPVTVILPDQDAWMQWCRDHAGEFATFEACYTAYRLADLG